MNIGFEVYSAADGALVEEFTLNCSFDQFSNSYIPDPTDWMDMLMEYTGNNVVIFPRDPYMTIQGLNDKGYLELLNDDGAVDSPDDVSLQNQAMYFIFGENHEK